MAGCATKSYDVHSRRPRYYVAAMANLHQSPAGAHAADDNLARVISFTSQLLPVKFPIRTALAPDGSSVGTLVCLATSLAKSLAPRSTTTST